MRHAADAGQPTSVNQDLVDVHPFSPFRFGVEMGWVEREVLPHPWKMVLAEVCGSVFDDAIDINMFECII